MHTIDAHRLHVGYVQRAFDESGFRKDVYATARWRGDCQFVVGVDVVWLLKIEHAHRAFRGKHPVGVDARECPHHGAFAFGGIEPVPYIRPDIQTGMWVDKLPALNAACESAPLIVVRCYRTQTMLLGFIEKMFNTCVLFRAVDDRERERNHAIHTGQCVQRGVSRLENGQKQCRHFPWRHWATWRWTPAAPWRESAGLSPLPSSSA